MAAVGIAASERRKALPASGTKGLPAGDRLHERTLGEMRVDDVITIDGRDFLCEGTIAYDEDGHRWVAGRCLDAGEVKWLMVGLERSGASAARLLVQDDQTGISG